MRKFEPLVDAVVGGWYGDESKALTVARKAKNGSYSAVARYNGGNNAGGKVVMPDGIIYKFNNLPAGLAYGIPAIIGRGVLLNAAALNTEIEEKRLQGLSINDGLLAVSDRATLILPGHIREDQQRESGKNRQGTTKKGIAQAAAARYGRQAPTAEMLAAKPEYVEQIALDGVFRTIKGGRANIQARVSAKKDVKEWMEQAREVVPYITNTDELVQDFLRDGKSILAEGAQSLGLSMESRDYPLVTSSHCGPAGIQIGLGVNYQQLREVVAVIKATPSRVGDGPFPTEITSSSIANRVRGERGLVDSEYGTVTGRERRVGWPDIKRQNELLVQHGISRIALTKLDCVPRYGLTLKVATDYDEKGNPKYQTFPTWQEDIQKCRVFEDLPRNAQLLTRMYQDELGVSVESVGVGPNEDQVIYL